MVGYDVLIVGGGPAGLSAATALVRQLHSSVLFDSGSYRNAAAKHMHSVPTWDHKDPEEFRASARRDLLARYQDIVHLEDTGITAIKRIDGGFEATDQSGKIWQGKKVILATGVKDEFPSIDGYAECWGKVMYVYRRSSRRRVLLDKLPLSVLSWLRSAQQWSSRSARGRHVRKSPTCAAARAQLGPALRIDHHLHARG